ncbi:amino acid/polyamine transporter I [Aspergillus avenaceus]|uniref:Amino acid/polyamine transporter I n=1 Tax=Aspergillus avenaceus TaxID=36643 RepID=A0A5N6U3P2_ASPAV|nr:amino acid/polyamine transporter I [Aspergillus avenaceus]
MERYGLKRPLPASLHEVTDPSQGGGDDANLARMGKKAVLRRNFGLMSILGFSCTILITWEGIATGGPAGSVYAFLFVWSGIATVFVVLSELVSMAPTAGGQYHWCSMLTSPSTMKLSSYVTGWMTVIGWQATYATSIYLSGTQIASMVTLTHSDYVPKAWHMTLYSYAIALIGLGLNCIGGKLLARFEGTILILHILGFFAILIPLTHMAEHKTAKEVFTHFINEGQWSSQGLSFFVGLIGPVFAFAGGDSAVHMAEEISHATTYVPWSLMLTVLINGTLGFSMLLALLFCLGDVDKALNDPTGLPFVGIFLQATESIPGTAVMASIIIVLCFCTSVGMLAAASRQLWSFSRDRGIPGWRVWSKVTTSNCIPTYSVVLTTTIAILLNLINVGSDVAFNSLVSMSTSGLYLSYMTVSGLLLYRRCTGGILQRTSAMQGGRDAETKINTAGAQLVWGPFHIPGIWGILINTYSLIYMFIATFFSFWPPNNHADVQSMNYSVVGTGGTIILSLLYYYVRARKVYSGPVVEI